MQITMLGLSGSGKTAFMAGLYEMLAVDNIGGFHLSAKSSSSVEAAMHGGLPSKPNPKKEPESFVDKAIDFMLAEGQFDQIAFGSRRDFPDGTAQSTKWLFDLTHDGEQIGNFQWIDYRGGILSDFSSPEIFSYIDEERPVWHELFDFIFKSDALVLCLDAFLLTYYYNQDSPQEARHRSGLVSLTRILRSYQDARPQAPLNVVVVLTKVDSLDQHWKDNDFSELHEWARQVVDEYFCTCLVKKRWKGYMMVVSAIGEGKAQYTRPAPGAGRDTVRVKTRLQQYPVPFQVAHVLLQCMRLDYERQHVILHARITEYQKKIVELEGYSGWKDLANIFTRKQPSWKQLPNLDAQKKSELEKIRKVERVLKILHKMNLNDIVRIMTCH